VITDKQRVLCVEDEPDTCELFSYVLTNFDIVVAGTKAKAVELARDDGFALILMDYYLPDGTGEEACEMIREFDKRTPILFVTASATFSEVRARSIGAQGALRKSNPQFIFELSERATELARTAG
jgi:CheY-like chemotaxis protein